jgi:hypothetical protein
MRNDTEEQLEILTHFEQFIGLVITSYSVQTGFGMSLSKKFILERRNCRCYAGHRGRQTSHTGLIVKPQLRKISLLHY